MTIETAAGTLAPRKKKFLPNKILRAIDQAAELQGLTTGIRTTLQTICRYVSQHDPLGPVFTRKAKIADRAGLSERTIHRHIVALESLGLLRTEDQRHGKKNGKFLVTHIFITEKLARMVGLIEAEPSESVPAPSDKMSCGYINDLSIPSSSSKNKQRRPHHRQRTEPTIPTDLQPLAELGMLPPTICKLMLEAKANGKRLSDIVAAVIDRLRELKLTGAKMRSYLLKAIASTTDFTKLASARAEERRQQQRANADAAFVADFRAKYAGRVLRSLDGREVVAIAANAEYAQHRIGTVDGTLPLVSRTDVAYLIGKIERGLLREERVIAPAMPVQNPQPRRAAPAEEWKKIRALVGVKREWVAA